MGFGILFYGFLMMIEVSVRTSAEYAIGIDFFPDLAGYLLMLTAACRLKAYAKGFDRFRIALLPLIAVGAVNFAVGILSGLGIVNEAMWIAVLVCKYAAMVLHPVAFFFLFAGIMTLANSVGLNSIAGRARFLAVLGSAYYAAQLFLMAADSLAFPLSASTMSIFSFFLIIVQLFFVIMTEVVLFQCYMYICYEGEEKITPQDAANPFARFFEKLRKGRDDR